MHDPTTARRLTRRLRTSSQSSRPPSPYRRARRRCPATKPTGRRPNATGTFDTSATRDEWLGNGTAATIFALAWRARSGGGSTSSAMPCASIPTTRSLPRSPLPWRFSTACSTSDAQAPSASPDRRHGKGFFRCTSLQHAAMRMIWPSAARKAVEGAARRSWDLLGELPRVDDLDQPRPQAHQLAGIVQGRLAAEQHGGRAGGPGRDRHRDAGLRRQHA